MIVRRDTAHIIVDGWQNRDRRLGHVNARKDARAFGNTRQTLSKNRRVQVIDPKGLPIGLQVMGANGSDMDTLAIAAWIQKQ